MKKFLSLVLALVMTMSLVTISAGAEGFTDADSIDYAAAIDVVKACKIIDGYTDGSFRPDAALNRGQAAKIICNLILGPTTAAALPTNVAPFSDVAAGSTFAGYIAYCAQQGIINGYTDGTFRPSNPLNGYAFMKMLLGALGYDGSVENFSGANWAVSVAKLALQIGLDDGVDAFVGSKTVTRQEACLYAFNALQADMVQYDTQSTIKVGDIEITSSSKAEPKAAKAGSVGYNGGTEEVVQLCEQYFSKLTADLGERDIQGRPVTVWSYDNKEVTKEAVAAEAVYTAGVNQDKVARALGFDTLTAYYYIDGVAADSDTDSIYEEAGEKVITIAKANKDVAVEGTGAGKIVEIYEDEGVMVVLNPDVVEINWVDEDDDGRYVQTVNGYKFYTEMFEEEDMVVVTYGSDAGVSKIVTMAKTEKLTGKITKIEGSKYTIGGTVYTKSASSKAAVAGNVGDTVNFWLDTNGYLLESEVASSAAAVENMALLLNADADRVPYAKLLFSDGTLKTVDIDTNEYATDGTYNGKKIVEWELDDGTYELDDVTTYYNAAANYYFTKGTAAIRVAAYNGTDAVKVDSTTTFVVVDPDDFKDADIYVGIENAPTFHSARVAYTVNKGVANLVFVMVDEADVSYSGKDVIFFVGKTTTTAPIEEYELDDYYNAYAIVNGEWKTLSVKDGSAADGYAGITTAVTYTSVPTVAYKELKYNTDGQVIDGTAVASGNKDELDDVQVVALKNGVITLNGTNLTAVEDCNVYLVASDLKSMTKVALGTINTDDNGVASNDLYKWGTYVTNSDGKLTDLMLVRW